LQRVADILIRCLPAMVWMGERGVPFDAKSWAALTETAQAEANRLRDELANAAPVRARKYHMVKLVDVGSIATHFETLVDLRHPRNSKLMLSDIAVICVAAIICGCDGPTAIHRWAVQRQVWLGEHPALANGIPSRDCIRRIPRALDGSAMKPLK
jgi:hypothetical protein